MLSWIQTHATTGRVFYTSTTQYWLRIALSPPQASTETHQGLLSSASFIKCYHGSSHRNWNTVSIWYLLGTLQPYTLFESHGIVSYRERSFYDSHMPKTCNVTNIAWNGHLLHKASPDAQLDEPSRKIKWYSPVLLYVIWHIIGFAMTISEIANQGDAVECLCTWS
jgi:hypothetical protein